MTPRDFAEEMYRLMVKQADEQDELYVAELKSGALSDVIVDGHIDLVKLSAELIGWVILQKPEGKV